LGDYQYWGVEGDECRANREKVPMEKGTRRKVSGFGLPPELMWAAVLIIAGERPH